MSDYGPLPRKSLRVGLGWWLVLGLLDAHRFYLRDYVVGTMYVATLGFLGVGWVVDLFLLPSKIREWNLRADGAWLDTREALKTGSKPSKIRLTISSTNSSHAMRHTRRAASADDAPLTSALSRRTR